MKVNKPHRGKRSVHLTMEADLLDRAEAAGINVTALAEEAVASALLAHTRQRQAAEIAQACLAHDAYLAVYGSLGEALRAAAKDGQ